MEWANFAKAVNSNDLDDLVGAINSKKPIPKLAISTNEKGSAEVGELISTINDFELKS